MPILSNLFLQLYQHILTFIYESLEEQWPQSALISTYQDHQYQSTNQSASHQAPLPSPSNHIKVATFTTRGMNPCSPQQAHLALALTEELIQLLGDRQSIELRSLAPFSCLDVWHLSQ